MAPSLRRRWNVLTRDNFTCQYCGRSSPRVELEVDHVIPVARGGGDEYSNLVTACHDCNSGKSASPTFELNQAVMHILMVWRRAPTGYPPDENLIRLAVEKLGRRPVLCAVTKILEPRTLYRFHGDPNNRLVHELKKDLWPQEASA